ncbi:MAG: Ig-like domain-containing domain [Saprospiraceae bacterium]
MSRPPGGDKDVTPPKLDSLVSTANFQTSFYPEEIVLEFDEYIQLKNASRDIILTPTPVAGKPKYEQRGRRVNIDFSEVELRDSTTYQLQFGEAIQDFNEGNPAKDLRFIFSTGSFVDSLSIRGTVKDNVIGAASINALVGLYRSPSDTILSKASPDYFARTDSSGRFAIGYLSAGSYQLAAYLDDNSNYRYNQGIEAVAFLDELVTVSATSTDTSYALTLSDERPPLKSLRGDQWFPGFLRITLNQPATDSIDVSDVPGEVLTRMQDTDSIYVAYAPANDTLPFVVLSFEGESDTVRLRKTARATPPRLTVDPRSKVIAGESVVQLDANLPLASFDESLIRVEVDSLPFPKGQWSISQKDQRKLKWQAPTDTVRVYDITFFPGALTTVFDSLNTDTILVSMRPVQKSEFGEVELTLSGLDSLTSYILELLDTRGDVERERQLPVGPEGRTSAETLIKLSRVEGGDYSVRIIEDLNKDGRYSPGNRRLNLQPERTITMPLNTVRADWLVEERLELNL